MAKAGKKDPKAPKDEKAANGPGIMGLLRTAGFALSMATALFLCISLLDMGFVDLRPQLHDFSGAAAGALLVFVMLSAFAGSRSRAAERSARDAQIDALKDELAGKLMADLETRAATIEAREAEVKAKVAAVDEKIDKFLGAAFERLTTENESFRKEIDQNRIDEVSKASEEVEALRAKNQELQDKINKWAVESVDSRIGQEKLHAA